MDYAAAIRTQLDSMWKGFITLLPNFVLALIVVFITWIVVKWAMNIANRMLDRTEARPDLRNLTETLVKLAIWILGLLIALTVAIPGFTPAGMVAGLGVGALAIGFAFQDIFENFLAGVLIMLRDKMNIGDVIEVQGILGKVEKISLRETHVRQLSNELTIMPNSILFKNSVKILTDANMRRDEFTVGVSYDADLDEAEAAIRRGMESGLDGIVEDRPVGIFCRDFGGSSIDWLVQYWCHTAAPRDMRLVRTAAIKAVKRELDAAGIEIPFPIVTNMFPEELRVAHAEPPKAIAEG